MGLQLAGRWVWDFWLAQDQGLWHVFYLHAPQTPADPDQRHFAAKIGHAVSPDLWAWEEQANAVAPGPPGSWDDLAAWTGSVVDHPDGGWAMLYTGVSSREQGLVQRIGLARSQDLHAWSKHPGNPVIEADARWYEMLDLEVWFDQAWRDPWVVRDPESGLFHAFITARSRNGEPGQRGVIGHCTSSDLITWTVGPPIEAPRGYGYMEVAQLFRTGGYWHLLFSAPAWAQEARPGPHCTGTFHAVAEDITGPFEEMGPVCCDPEGSSYGGKIVETAPGAVFLAFRNLDEGGSFIGEIADPRPVVFAADGTITLVENRL